MNPKAFREYDIRGIVGSDIRDEDVVLLGKTFATYMLRQGKKNVVVGRGLPAEFHEVSRPSDRRHAFVRPGYRGRGGVPDASLLFCDTSPGSRGGDHDHRQPQPSRIQRLQDLQRLRHDCGSPNPGTERDHGGGGLRLRINRPGPGIRHSDALYGIRAGEHHDPSSPSGGDRRGQRHRRSPSPYPFCSGWVLRRTPSIVTWTVPFRTTNPIRRSWKT